MKRKLSKELQKAITDYYENRDNQKVRGKWNKVRDLDLIGDASKNDGFTSFEACVGTFWFGKTIRGVEYTFKVNEKNYLSTLKGYKTQAQSNALHELNLSSKSVIAILQ